MAILACVALALSLVATATASSKTAAESTLSTASTPALASITTAPIYLPGYNNESWKPVRGSIIGSVRSLPMPLQHISNACPVHIC